MQVMLPLDLLPAVNCLKLNSKAQALRTSWQP